MVEQEILERGAAEERQMRQESSQLSYELAEPEVRAAPFGERRRSSAITSSPLCANTSSPVKASCANGSFRLACRW
jgi:hypothetical protein